MVDATRRSAIERPAWISYEPFTNAHEFAVSSQISKARRGQFDDGLDALAGSGLDARETGEPAGGRLGVRPRPGAR